MELSLILCSRNDAYMGNSRWRLETTLNSLGDRVRALGKTGDVEVVVADNGCGFDPVARPGGVGLRSIRERIESLGGVVGIDSLPDCGTRLSVRLPIDGSDNGSGTGDNYG